MHKERKTAANNQSKFDRFMNKWDQTHYMKTNNTGLC